MIPRSRLPAPRIPVPSCRRAADVRHLSGPTCLGQSGPRVPRRRHVDEGGEFDVPTCAFSCPRPSVVSVRRRPVERHRAFVRHGASVRHVYAAAASPATHCGRAAARRRARGDISDHRIDEPAAPALHRVRPGHATVQPPRRGRLLRSCPQRDAPRGVAARARLSRRGRMSSPWTPSELVRALPMSADRIHGASWRRYGCCNITRAQGCPAPALLGPSFRETGTTLMHQITDVAAGPQPSRLVPPVRNVPAHGPSHVCEHVSTRSRLLEFRIMLGVGRRRSPRHRTAPGAGAG
jgi:hypothetical protein